MNLSCSILKLSGSLNSALFLPTATELHFSLGLKSSFSSLPKCDCSLSACLWCSSGSALWLEQLLLIWYLLFCYIFFIFCPGYWTKPFQPPLLKWISVYIIILNSFPLQLIQFQFIFVEYESLQLYTETSAGISYALYSAPLSLLEINFLIHFGTMFAFFLSCVMLKADKRLYSNTQYLPTPWLFQPVNHVRILLDTTAWLCIGKFYPISVRLAKHLFHWSSSLISSGWESLSS